LRRLHWRGKRSSLAFEIDAGWDKQRRRGAAGGGREGIQEDTYSDQNDRFRALRTVLLISQEEIGLIFEKKWGMEAI